MLPLNTTSSFLDMRGLQIPDSIQNFASAFSSTNVEFVPIPTHFYIPTIGSLRHWKGWFKCHTRVIQTMVWSSLVCRDDDAPENKDLSPQVRDVPWCLPWLWCEVWWRIVVKSKPLRWKWINMSLRQVWYKLVRRIRGMLFIDFSVEASAMEPLWP